jgi:hypothetical protein
MDGADHGCLVANHHFWVTGTKGLGFEEASIFPKIRPFIVRAIFIAVITAGDRWAKPGLSEPGN